MKLNLKPAHLTKAIAVISLIIMLGINNVSAQIANSHLIDNQIKEDEAMYTLFIPNCFTPNGDGKNDEFVVSSEFLKRVSLRIYDKAGEEVFATIEMAHGWNGKHNGRELKQDVYLYRIEATYMNGKEELLVGQINLMR